MDAFGSHESNQAYYDAFAEGYEAQRGANDPGGYHELLDELESDYVRRFGQERDVLEVGCGTGLLLQRIQRFAKTAKGVDLSPGMLEKAKARGLDVVLGSATALPFDADSFDVTCSFKVLAHIPDVALVLKEMARVTRPGGTMLAEFYNPHSLRGLIKRFGPAGRIARHATESHVYTRYDSPSAVRRLIPSGCELIGSRGVRIVIPVAGVMCLPIIRNVLRAAERALSDSPLAIFGCFWIAAIRKAG